MKHLKTIGLVLFLLGLITFVSSLFVGSFSINQSELSTLLNENEKQNLLESFQTEIADKNFASPFEFTNKITSVFSAKNEELKALQQWDKVMWNSPQEFALPIVKSAAQGSIKNNKTFWLLITIGLCCFGGLIFILPDLNLYKTKGVKNDNVFKSSISSQGVVGIITGAFLISFYILLYWFPSYIVSWVLIVDPISELLSGNPASQWFLYGLLYTLIMLVMGIRMLIKYRGNKYQIFRTISVMFFQTAFAFLIPEILVRLNQPYMDFKNIWPLDYDFFFQWNLDQLIASGGIGIFILVWGILLFAIAVPVFTYFYGKRWYCSWVCGCGGLAETMGDPFRQLSNKTLKAWKIERISIHSVLVFVLVMTIATLYSYFSGEYQILGVETSSIQKTYGFLIGSAFAGVVGTGFYPLMGNRMWCRFGCPLAGYIGLIQKFKSKFRITTNGGQCISCGNCSTYCEMGIDVRWYAQRGQNIVRSSCVGCGVCSAVCPRGVLKLENGSEVKRVNDNPILIGDKNIQVIHETF